MEYNHQHDPGNGHHHGSAGAARANWRGSDLPFRQKLRLAARNTWIKISRRQPCCGHPGEPGC